MALMRQIAYSSASTPLTPDTGSKYFDLAQFPTLEQVDSGTYQPRTMAIVSCLYSSLQWSVYSVVSLPKWAEGLC